MHHYWPPGVIGEPGDRVGGAGAADAGGVKPGVGDENPGGV